MLSYPSAMTVSSRALTTLTDALRRHRNQRATRWRKLSAGRQALLVVAYLRKGETYMDLACGFKVGTSTVYRYVREAIGLLAAMAPTLAQAIEVARRKAFVILDGTLLRPDDTISDRDRRAVAAAAEAGWPVVLATARWYQLAERSAQSLGLVDPVIACSGAEVRRLRDGVDLLDVHLPAGFTAELYALCEEHEAIRGSIVMVYEERDVAVRSATATPSSSALCASIGPRTTSPIAHTLGKLVRHWSSTTMAPRSCASAMDGARSRTCPEDPG